MSEKSLVEDKNNWMVSSVDKPYASIFGGSQHKVVLQNIRGGHVLLDQTLELYEVYLAGQKAEIVGVVARENAILVKAAPASATQ